MTSSQSREMSPDLPAPHAPQSPRVVVLAIAQAFFTAALAVDLTLTGITGYQLAPDKALATLPFAMITVAGAVATWFAAQLMRRVGRRYAFVIGAATCAVGGCVSVWSVIHGNFWVFCLGTAAVGVFQAFAQYYRLAAADSVDANAKARAISMVLAGGVVAAFLGPLLAAWSRHWLSTVFAGSYLAVDLLGAASALLFLLAYRDQPDHIAPVAGEPVAARALPAILSTPISLAALANNAVGGFVMMFIMTVAPLAAMEAHYSVDDGASVIQWHLVGMYAPSLFAGRLIDRLGLPVVVFAGIGLSALCPLVALGSGSLLAYHAALLCLGVGWNFMFVGGTTLLASSYQPSERTKVQGAAELLRYATTAVATLAAGPVLERFGWEALNVAMFPLLALATVMTIRWVRREGAAWSGRRA
ncbi:MAG: Riboflavin transporter RfnT [Luteibacter sp.]|uniref:MFS transporter n=1 Tax=Luteibacter sp. TaxID=1886636 RepID=UPI00137CA46F|nr:MFS transporter [Luteibacter sp.]KAF1007226.1 MAG: Riboflavin transporter RfnT [Luteibacter sp.]